ncbi:MAG: helix-turn-helix domain-containing protein, partial [Patescibacteria group bacterium]|nr:helix-turn-helix domain-containing protein [Patescibacteria group bacterium]
MNEPIKSKRVIFKKDKQKNLINSSKNELSLTWNDFAKILNISSRQLIDWRNEKNSITLGALNKICS